MTYLQHYNVENRISSIIKLASGNCAAPGNSLTQWDFAYDGDGTRVATLISSFDANGQNPTPVSSTSYYFGGAYETRSDGTAIKYYSVVYPELVEGLGKPLPWTTAQDYNTLH